MDDFIKNIIKRPFQRGDKVLVYNGHNKLIETHSTIELGKAYFSMSNDSFFDVYGFNFVPNGRYHELSKKAAGKM
jgi:hypothetical protein